MAKISAVEAEKRMGEYMKNKTGRHRTIPPVNGMIQTMIRENTVHCFSVGPWGSRVNMGSFGYYFIPPCVVGAPMEWVKLPLPKVAAGVYVPDVWEEGDARVTEPKKEYAAFRPLPGLMMEPLPTDMDVCSWNQQDEGKYFANEMLGVGIGHDTNTSWIRKGCFVAEGKEPTTKELGIAREQLMKFMAEQVLDADRAWAAGPQRAEAIIRPEIHHVCAEWMNLEDRDWLRGTSPVGRVKCMGCGAMTDAGVATCPNGHIVDAVAYKAFMAQQAAMQKAIG